MCRLHGWIPSLLKDVFLQVDDDPGAFGRLDVTGAPLLVTLSRSYLPKSGFTFPRFVSLILVRQCVFEGLGIIASSTRLQRKNLAPQPRLLLQSLLMDQLAHSER